MSAAGSAARARDTRLKRQLLAQRSYSALNLQCNLARRLDHKRLRGSKRGVQGVEDDDAERHGFAGAGLSLRTAGCSAHSCNKSRAAPRRACTIKSAPKRPSGTAFCCTGDGCEKPALCKLRTSSGCVQSCVSTPEWTESTTHRQKQVGKRGHSALYVGGHVPLLAAAFARHLRHAQGAWEPECGRAASVDVRPTRHVTGIPRRPPPQCISSTRRRCTGLTGAAPAASSDGASLCFLRYAAAAHVGAE